MLVFKQLFTFLKRAVPLRTYFHYTDIKIQFPKSRTFSIFEQTAKWKGQWGSKESLMKQLITNLIGEVVSMEDKNDENARHSFAFGQKEQHVIQIYSDYH
jgi:hypothetical protein